MTTFQIDVSRTYRNKEGYKPGAGYKLNNSFETETHTPQSFLNTIVKEGWPYTMVHRKRSPQETGAIKRNPNLSTPKHLENFISRQELTADELVSYCRKELAGFKIPKKVVFGPIDKTSTGKVQKYLLREKAEQVEYAAKK